MKNILLILANVFLTVTAQIMLKYGMNKVGKIDSFENLRTLAIKAISNPFVIGGIGIFGFTSILWLIVLSRVEISVAYPMLSLGYVLVMLWGWLVFDEKVSIIRFLGVILICLGVFLITRGID